MKRLFCKHKWCMFYAATQEPLQLEENFVRCGMKLGVCVYCSKCGKQRKRLAKKITKILSNSYANKLEERAKRVSYKIIEEMDNEKFKNIYKQH